VGANGLCMAISADGKTLWQQDLGQWVEGAPAVSLSLIYFTSQNYCVTAMTPDGNMAWADNMHTGITASPAIATNGVIYLACGGYLYAIGPTNATPPADSSWPVFRANVGHTGRVAAP
jgi:hypothetical protein